ncbi:uncharacterized protein SAPINGB_P002547 [Magnusiomyces paraingens]|uniref:Uncharacterized protein n=1 Tax=Magnusiomyces paraingens TaxID=2606893 RepID=A0A5E8BEH1_9ASCO|nr:uncharacterized protein SAPINGB_P002547 [Saprochaete ingens]VVT49993.1 unnamed protein product [Saprochaete ingens]
MEARRAKVRKTKSNAYSSNLSELDSITSSYGSKVLNLIISNNIYPSYEPTFAPIRDALRIHPGDKSNTSLYIPSDFHINEHWSPAPIFYNPDGDYSSVDELEEEHVVHEEDQVGYGNSYYMSGTVLFNYTDPLSGSFLSCGLTDKWENIIIDANGAYTLEMSKPNVPILPHVLCVNNTSNNNDTKFNIQSDSLEPYFVINPGENFTFFGVNNETKKIYANNFLYYEFNYNSYNLLIEPQFYYDPLNFFKTNLKLFDSNSSSSNHNVRFNMDCNGRNFTIENNITQSLLDFHTLYVLGNVSYVLTFTLAKHLEGNLSSFGIFHNKVALGYFRYSNVLTITQSLYFTKKTIFEFEYNDNITSTTTYQTAKTVEKWGTHLIPIVLNIKVPRFVYTVLSETLGITVKGSNELGFYYPGKIRYEATSIVIAIVSVTLASLVLFFITKLILYKCPQGIPTYYGLLHEYHKNRLDASPPYDADIERQSIFKIIDKAYEGVGYDGRLQRNRVGVLDEVTIRTGTNKNGVIKRRFIH